MTSTTMNMAVGIMVHLDATSLVVLDLPYHNSPLNALSSTDGINPLLPPPAGGGVPPALRVGTVGSYSRSAASHAFTPFAMTTSKLHHPNRWQD